ncbi:glucose-1-phosphate adenylyltransferase subunit GlgD [candidate division CSSED10-310 bacterium]|uniref:Glucose-1-phosphate adenylyltransferase subunit GlgD n=1 Tax=candidate division CSSED10-310 bacterium TaxID=2855610 RepID=A0ABV6YYA6_UNCC1
MTVHDTIAFVLAGSKKSSLDILTRKRAKASIPFGAIYRVIDFVLSNMMNTGISHVGVLTQYRAESLMDHIDDGQAWDLHGRRRGIKILPPYQRQFGSDWYRGTADAIYQNLNFIKDHDPDYVLIASGDHIYNTDYSALLRWHYDKNADISIVTKKFPHVEPRSFGMVKIDDDFRVVDYDEKPTHVRFQDISLGIYVFDTEVLVPLLEADAKEKSTHDIGRDIIAQVVNQKRVFAYPFTEPWFYLGDIRAYWNCNMELLKEKPDINLRTWGVETNLVEGNVANLPSTRFRGAGQASNCIIANGCVIEGKVVNSILFPEVKIGPQVLVENSILMNKTQVERGTRLNEIIADKEVVFGKNIEVGHGLNVPNEHFPHYYNTGITVFAKGVYVGEGLKIGKNVLVFSDLLSSDGHVPSGSTHGGTL